MGSENRSMIEENTKLRIAIHGNQKLHVYILAASLLSANHVVEQWELHQTNHITSFKSNAHITSHLQHPTVSSISIHLSLLWSSTQPTLPSPFSSPSNPCTRFGRILFLSKEEKKIIFYCTQDLLFLLSSVHYVLEEGGGRREGVLSRSSS